MKKHLILFVTTVLLICIGLSGCTDDSAEKQSDDDKFLSWFNVSYEKISSLVDSLEPYFEKRLMDIWDYNTSKYVKKNTYDDINLIEWGEKLEDTSDIEKNKLTNFSKQDLSEEMKNLFNFYEKALTAAYTCGINAKMAGFYGAESGYDQYIQIAQDNLSLYNNYLGEALEITGNY